jgi:hypothetical protein
MLKQIVNVFMADGQELGNIMAAHIHLVVDSNPTVEIRLFGEDHTNTYELLNCHFQYGSQKIEMGNKVGTKKIPAPKKAKV